MTAIRETASEPLERVHGGPARQARGPRRSLLRLWARPLGLYVASRLLVLVAAAAGALVAGTAGRSVPTGPWPAVDGTDIGAFDALLRWDSAWYVQVADRGYSPQVHGAAGAVDAFFPLYPALVRVAGGVLGLSPAVAALLVATLTGAAATVLVWQLAHRLCPGEDPGSTATADRVAALFAFFPGTVALSMAYSEGLLIALAAACLLALVDRRWLLAGGCAALATATRPTGLALVLACAWAAAVHLRRQREWRALLAPALAPLGAVGFFGLLWVRTGEPLAWFVAQREAWGEHVDAAAAVRRIGVALAHPVGQVGTERDLNALVPAIGTVLALLLVVLLLRWRPPGAVLVYALVALGLALVSATIGPRPRMILAAFPLVMAAGVVLRGTAFTVALCCCAGLLALLEVLTVGTLAVTP